MIILKIFLIGKKQNENFFILYFLLIFSEAKIKDMHVKCCILLRYLPYLHKVNKNYAILHGKGGIHVNIF